MIDPTRFRSLAIAALLLIAVAQAAEDRPIWVVVIGDSLSEENAFMIDLGGPYTDFGFSSPDSDPTDANTANWVEVLSAWRGPGTDGDHLVFGSYANTWPAYSDLRQAGYAGNFGIPGYTSFNWAVLLGSPQDPLQQATRDQIGDQIATFEALDLDFVIVIMLGGNDLKVDYNDIFNDTEPPGLYDTIVARLMTLAGVLDGPTGSRPVVMCTVPDVGVSPNLMDTYNDPARRASTRAKIQAMNDDLKTRAAAAGYAVADVHALTIRMEDEVPIKTNGQAFIMDGDPENPPNYLFCKDGFHPGTLAHTVLANEVIDAINELLGSSIEPLANREVLRLISGLDPDKPFNDWIATQGVAQTGMGENPDGDPFDNLAEFTFGLRAGVPDPGFTHGWSGPGGDRFGILWSPNPAADGYVEIRPMRSPDLVNWSPLDPGDIEDLGNGNWRASIDPGDPAAFLKTEVTPAP